MTCKSSGERKTSLFAVNAHGYFDLKVYQEYLARKLERVVFPKENIEAALAKLPDAPAPEQQQKWKTIVC